MTNLVADIADTAAEMPENVALSFAGQDVPYAAFWARVGQFAQGLADAGVEPGDRVGIYLPNLPQYVTAFHGVLRAGGIVVPMNPQYKSREISHLLADSEASVVVTLADLVPFVQEVRDETAVETVVSVNGAADGAVTFEEFLADEELDVVERADDDVAVQPYTSGTTGTPKGVLLSHHNLAWTSRTNAELLDGGLTPDDGLVGTLPLFHIYGMSVVMNAALVNGAAYYPVTEWDATEVMD